MAQGSVYANDLWHANVWFVDNPLIEYITMPSEVQLFEADICLVLEGTYPYVSGGVSSWVHRLIVGMPQYTFSLICILPNAKNLKQNYVVPANVVNIRNVLLQSAEVFAKPWWGRIFRRKTYRMLEKFHDEMPFSHKNFDSKQSCPHFKEMVNHIIQEKWNPAQILYSRRSWRLLLKIYKRRGHTTSFIDYTWTWRFLHAGIFAIFHADVPRCRLYHTVSTGYAGLYGARASILAGRPLIITEHGIYSKERKIEISRSSWIFDKTRLRYRPGKEQSTFKQIWITAFRAISKFCYDQAIVIITLYSGNQVLQIEDGAPKEKMRVIPNAVDFNQFNAMPRQKQPFPVVGFVGRVVSIKDVKTFIRAMYTVMYANQEVQAWVLGPTDEEPEYYEECVQLVESLELKNRIQFFGKVDLKHYYPKLDVLVLTSISEGQPLVILEAQALGVPVVSTDVGACRELLEGLTDEDRELGPSGLLTGLASPDETARSVLSILSNQDIYDSMSQTAIQRIKRFYDMPVFFKRYNQLYQSCFNQPTIENEAVKKSKK